MRDRKMNQVSGESMSCGLFTHFFVRRLTLHPPSPFSYLMNDDADLFPLTFNWRSSLITSITIPEADIGLNATPPVETMTQDFDPSYNPSPPQSSPSSASPPPRTRRKKQSIIAEDDDASDDDSRSYSPAPRRNRREKAAKPLKRRFPSPRVKLPASDKPVSSGKSDADVSRPNTRSEIPTERWKAKPVGRPGTPPDAASRFTEDGPLPTAPGDREGERRVRRKEEEARLEALDIIKASRPKHVIESEESSEDEHPVAKAKTKRPRSRESHRGSPAHKKKAISAVSNGNAWGESLSPGSGSSPSPDGPADEAPYPTPITATARAQTVDTADSTSVAAGKARAKNHHDLPMHSQSDHETASTSRHKSRSENNPVSIEDQFSAIKEMYLNGAYATSSLGRRRSKRDAEDDGSVSGDEDGSKQSPLFFEADPDIISSPDIGTNGGDSQGETSKGIFPYRFSAELQEECEDFIENVRVSEVP